MPNFGSHGVRKLVSFSCFRHLLRFSTSLTEDPSHKTTHFMVDYLANSLGFSRDEAISVSTKLTHLKSRENPDSVLNFLKQSGFEDTQIKTLVSFIPILLCFKVEKTLKPKIRVFQDIGLSGSALGDLILKDPFILTRGVDTYIVPSIEFLGSILGSKEKVIKAIMKPKWLFSYDIQKRLQPNISFLQNCGVSNKRLEKLILNNPGMFVMKPTQMEKIVERAEVDFGITRELWMFSYAIEVLSSYRKATLESKFRLFSSFGWLKSDIITMTRNLPYCLGLSEAKILRGLNFLMKELGYEPGYIASHPKLLMYSFERRVLPRHNVMRILKEKKLIKVNPCLDTVVHLPETKFLQKFVFKYKDKVPEMYEAYIESVEGGTK